MSNKYKFLDIFCGCGGMSLGFKDAGFDFVMGVDNDIPSLNTLKYNFPEAQAVNVDLFKKESAYEIQSKFGKKQTDIFNIEANIKPDVIIGGPPCQGLSLTGPRKFDDPRNRLYLAFIDLIKVLHPSAFVIENVPGMKNLYSGRVFDEIKRRFEKLDYTFEAKILNSADFGVPQIRTRLFIVGLRKKLGHFQFPEPSLKSNKYISCKNAISDLPARKPEDGIGKDEDKYDKPASTSYQKKMRNRNNILWNHVGTNHMDFVIDTIAQVPDGGNWRDLPPGVGESRKFNEAWTRYKSDKPSRTIDTGHRNHFHYEYNRVPTNRENARLQSFPDSFRLTGNKSQQNRQVGNAVPPLLAKALAEQLKTYLK